MRKQTLPPEKYDRMWEAYLERQTPNHVAKTVGCTWTTARRYIEEGDPRRNLDPLRVRFQEHRQVVREEIDRSVNEVTVENLKIVETFKMRGFQRLLEQLTGGVETVKVVEGDQEMTVTTNAEIEVRPRDILDAMKLELKMMGEPDEVMEIRITHLVGLCVTLFRAEMVSVGLAGPEVDAVVERVGQRLSSLGQGEITGNGDGAGDGHG